MESSAIPVSQLQFYIDQDVELRREVTADEAKVISGKVLLENGKYISVIYLKKGTPGVCTATHNNKLDVSFEAGDGKSLVFGVYDNPASDEPYRIFADAWVNEHGRIKYDGKLYNIQPFCAKAKLLIKKSQADKLEVNKRTLKGRRVA